MTTKQLTGFTKNIYQQQQQFCPSPVDSLHLQTPSPTMQYAQYSSVVLTPSTMSSPSPPSTGDNYSPGYIAENDYHLVQSHLNSPIKQEPHHFANSIASLTSNMLNYQLTNQLSNQLTNQLSNQITNQLTNQLNQQQTDQTNPQNQIARNASKRPADDSNANTVKRGRSRSTAPNRNQQTAVNQTKCPPSNQQPNVQQIAESKSQISKPVNAGEPVQVIAKPTRTRRTRAKSPTLVQKLKKNRRMKANDRERNRMHTLNRALERLRDILPVAGTMAAVAASASNGNETGDDTMSNCANKLTKIETLRFANRYILELSTMLQRDFSQMDAGKSPEATLQECAMAAAASIASPAPANPHHLLLNTSQNRFQNFSSIFNTASPICSSNGVLSSSSLSNDEDDEDLLMMVNECMNNDEDIFEPQTAMQQQVYHMN